jgi:hypothetical protein
MLCGSQPRPLLIFPYSEQNPSKPPLQNPELCVDDTAQAPRTAEKDSEIDHLAGKIPTGVNFNLSSFRGASSICEQFFCPNLIANLRPSHLQAALRHD